MLGASSPRTALPLPAAHRQGRAASRSPGRGTARRWLAQAGRDAAALFSSPQGSTAAAPSLLHTSSMPRPRVGTDRFHALGGRATALASGLIHTTLGRATLLLPDSRTKLDPQSQAAMGSASPKEPVLPCFLELASKTAQHCHVKQGKAAPRQAHHGTMVKAVVGALPSCLARNTRRPGTTQPGVPRGMLEHQPGGGWSSLRAQAPLTPSPGTHCSRGACAHASSL